MTYPLSVVQATIAGRAPHLRVTPTPELAAITTTALCGRVAAASTGSISEEAARADHTICPDCRNELNNFGVMRTAARRAGR